MNAEQQTNSNILSNDYVIMMNKHFFFIIAQMDDRAHSPPDVK